MTGRDVAADDINNVSYRSEIYLCWETEERDGITITSWHRNDLLHLNLDRI